MNLSSIKSFNKLDFKDKILVIETFILLGISRLLISFFEFKKIAPILGQASFETSNEPLSKEEPIVRRIKYTVDVMSRHTPWKSECLVQALAAKLMLKVRKIKSTVYLGVAKEGEEVVAHAWVRSGDIILTGGSCLEKYKIISQFGDYQ